MNPLTLVKRIQKINSKEVSLGISDDASWHAKYKDSAYVFVGGIPFQLTEGDLLAVFAQYGEIVDLNLVRDKGTGKSKGFAFLAYEDQRSTNLAVDNLNGASILGRIVRVDHVADYKKKQEEEDEEEEKRKREARGVCYAFQKGECHRGDACRFSHDEQRNANTGAQEVTARWEHDRSGDAFSGQSREGKSETRDAKYRLSYKDRRSSRGEVDKGFRHHQERKNQDERGHEKLSERSRRETKRKVDRDEHSSHGQSSRHPRIESHREHDRGRERSERRNVHSSDRKSGRHGKSELCSETRDGDSTYHRHQEGKGSYDH